MNEHGDEETVDLFNTETNSLRHCREMFLAGVDGKSWRIVKAGGAEIVSTTARSFRRNGEVKTFEALGLASYSGMNEQRSDQYAPTTLASVVAALLRS